MSECALENMLGHLQDVRFGCGHPRRRALAYLKRVEHIVRDDGRRAVVEDGEIEGRTIANLVVGIETAAL